jgi:hypothetical protein
VRKQEVTAPTGQKIEVTAYGVDKGFAEGQYMVMAQQMPAKIPDALADTAFDAGMTSLTQKQPGKVAKSEAVRVAGYPARDVVYEFQNPPAGAPPALHMRLILVDQTLYLLMCGGGIVNEERAREFFDTFRPAKAAGE